MNEGVGNKLLFPELENAGKETHLKLHPDLRVLWCCCHFYDDVLTDCSGIGRDWGGGLSYVYDMNFRGILAVNRIDLWCAVVENGGGRGGFARFFTTRGVLAKNSSCSSIKREL